MGKGGGVGVCDIFLKKCIVDLNVYLKSNVVSYMYVVYGVF